MQRWQVCGDLRRVGFRSLAQERGGRNKENQIFSRCLRRAIATASVRLALRFAPHPKASAALFLHTPCLTYRNCAFKKWSTEPFLVLPRRARRVNDFEGSAWGRFSHNDPSGAANSRPKGDSRRPRGRIFFLCRWESRTPDPRREWDNPTASHRPRKEWDEPLTTRPATIALAYFNRFFNPFSFALAAFPPGTDNGLAFQSTSSTVSMWCRCPSPLLSYACCPRPRASSACRSPS